MIDHVRILHTFEIDQLQHAWFLCMSGTDFSFQHAVSFYLFCQTLLPENWKVFVFLH
jgi:hypothetical protein